MAGAVARAVRGCKLGKCAIAQQPTMHGGHGLAIFVIAADKIALRRNTNYQCVTKRGSGMIKQFRRNIDRIDEIGLLLARACASESMGYGAYIVVSHDNPLYADPTHHGGNPSR